VRIVRRPLFLDDLTDAYRWIAKDSQEAAERLLDCVERGITRLQQFPLIGTPRDALAAGLRSLRARPFRHLMFYRVAKDEIVLVRLLHGARALERQDYGS
jgi:plasmid stabilization system protein ParE